MNGNAPLALCKRVSPTGAFVQRRKSHREWRLSFLKKNSKFRALMTGPDADGKNVTSNYFFQFFFKKKTAKYIKKDATTSDVFATHH
jgi:hypothetical protein